MVGPFSTADDGFQAEAPRIWPGGRFEQRGPWRMFDLHPDGERLGLRPRAGSAPQSHVTFVFNFFDELRRTASVAKR
jgi:hypothetical protein